MFTYDRVSCVPLSSDYASSSQSEGCLSWKFLQKLTGIEYQISRGPGIAVHESKEGLFRCMRKQEGDGKTGVEATSKWNAANNINAFLVTSKSSIILKLIRYFIWKGIFLKTSDGDKHWIQASVERTDSGNEKAEQETSRQWGKGTREITVSGLSKLWIWGLSQIFLHTPYGLGVLANLNYM